MKLWHQIDLPPIPTGLIVHEDWSAATVVNDIGYGITHYKNGVKLEPCEYKALGISYQPLKDWLTREIRGVTEKQMYMFETVHPAGGTHIVHSDIFRHCALNYIVDTGGDNVVTSWYQEKGKPLRRGPKTVDFQTDLGSVDYADLELLDSVVFKKNKWYLISTDVLHDVSNVTGHRRCVTIDYNNFFTKYMWDQLFEFSPKNNQTD